MDQWLDNLAKDSAHRLSRRQVFGRVAGGFGVAVLGIFGFARRAKADESCVAKTCAVLCNENFHQDGPGRAECNRLCHARQEPYKAILDLQCPEG